MLIHLKQDWEMSNESLRVNMKVFTPEEVIKTNKETGLELELAYYRVLLLENMLLLVLVQLLQKMLVTLKLLLEFQLKLLKN